MIQGAFARARAPVALLPADPSYDAHLDVELLGRLVAEGVVGLAAEWASRRLLEIVDQLLGREVVVAAARGGGATGLLTPPAAPTLGTRQVRGGRTVRAGVCRFGALVIFGALRAPAETVPEMLAQACVQPVALVLELLAALLGSLAARPQLTTLEHEDTDLLDVMVVLRDELGDAAISPRTPQAGLYHTGVTATLSRPCPVPGAGSEGTGSANRYSVTLASRCFRLAIQDR